VLAGPILALLFSSVHARELDAHRDEAPAVRTMPAAEVLAAGRAKTVDRVVYGYYPYWAADLDAIRWSALTHLAWFSIEIDGTGAVTSTHGWPDETTVAAAHAAGVRVDLTFTLFDGPAILALTSSPTRRATAIDAMIDQLEAGDADGISVDFEGLIDGTRAHFATFIAELRAALDARGHADAEISIAGPAVNWAGSDGLPEFDLPTLLDSADYYFIMGYGYFWGGSSHAGPIGMLELSPAWRAVQSWSMRRTIADFASEVGAEKRHQIIHGIPYYGREWITADDTLAADANDHVGSVTYSAAMADLAAGRERRWDDGAQQPWYAWQESGAWHQVWYDDEESLAVKYRMIVDQDLGGAGIWALNYDNGHDALWDQLEASFGADPAPVPGERRDPLPIDSASFHDERTTVGAPGDYFDRYACDPETPEYGREWVYRIELCAPTRLDATVMVADGADVDLHLLDALDEAACLARDDAALSMELEPGTYYLVVDTYVRDLVTAEGAYELDVALAAGDGAICVAADPDAGPGGGELVTGCGCASNEGGAAAPLALVALFLVFRRRVHPDDLHAARTRRRLDGGHLGS
jgi:MYXO-CTERM domain-containing protein